VALSSRHLVFKLWPTARQEQSGVCDGLGLPWACPLADIDNIAKACTQRRACRRVSAEYQRLGIRPSAAGAVGGVRKGCGRGALGKDCLFECLRSIVVSRVPDEVEKKARSQSDQIWRRHKAHQQGFQIWPWVLQDITGVHHSRIEVVRQTKRQLLQQSLLPRGPWPMEVAKSQASRDPVG